MRKRFVLIAVACCLIAALTLLRSADPKPVQDLRMVYFDILQRLKPRAAADLPVRIVDIDETSLAEIGQWPWPRDVLADLTRALVDRGAAVVAFDVIFAEPDRLSPAALAGDALFGPLLGNALDGRDLAGLDRDAIFAAAIAEAPVVLGSARVPRAAGRTPAPKAEILSFGDALEATLPAPQAMTPILPELEAAAAGIGSISVAPGDEATVVRRVPLAWDTDAGIMPSLAMEALRVALGEDTLILWPDEANAGDIAAVGVGAFDVPVTRHGEFWLHYRPESPDAYISAADILSGVPHDGIEGAIVFVGASAAGLLDIRTTALGQTVPGVSIHAQVVEQILTSSYLERSEFLRGLEILTFVFLGLVVASIMSIAGPAWSIAGGGAAALVTVFASWWAFDRGGQLIDVTFPLVGGFVAFSILSLLRLFVIDRDARLLKRSFSHFVAPDVLEEIEKEGHNINLGGTDREVTVMFTDIRSFTQLSSSLSAQELVALLNRLFTRLGQAIMAENGTIDKFMGDAIMAFWNAPVVTADHGRRACRAALRMRGALDRFNEAETDRVVRMGVGLSLGEACVGNIGSRDHFNYTAIGDTVNVASRVEGLCRPLDFDIAATEETRNAVPEFAWLDAGVAELKGLGRRHRIFILVGDEAVAGSPAFRALEAAHQALCDALRTGSGAGPELARCRGLATDVLPELVGYFDAIDARRADFLPVEAENRPVTPLRRSTGTG